MMSAIPQYYVPVKALITLQNEFTTLQLRLICAETRHIQKNQTTFYTEWEIRDSQNVGVFISVIENSGDSDTAVITAGSLDGKRGFQLLKEVQKRLATFSVKIDNPENQL